MPIGLTRGDLLETRIIPYEDKILLSRSVIIHPQEIKGIVKKGIKKIIKENSIDRFEYFKNLSYARLKLDRFANPDKMKIIYEKVARGEYDSAP